MPKPKKGEIYATFNNDFAYERALEKLNKMSAISIELLDKHTIKITLQKKNDQKLEEAVKSTIRNWKGYVEHDLETINALNVARERKPDSGVLDTPFYG
jgi:16S rRNA G527 N7-methylase RsmG